MTMLKEYNGAITLEDVLTSDPALECIMHELHSEEVDRVNGQKRKVEGENIIRQMRGR